MNLAAIKIKYQALVTLKIFLNNLELDLIELGPIPQYPPTAISDASYNDITTARSDWQIQSDSLRDTGIIPYRGAVISAENDLKEILPESQWVKLTGITGIGFSGTVYIGYGPGTTNADNPHRFPSIVTSSVEPVNDYPSI